MATAEEPKVGPKITRAFVAWAVVVLVGSALILVFLRPGANLVAFMVLLVGSGIAYEIGRGLNESRAEARAKTK